MTGLWLLAALAGIVLAVVVAIAVLTLADYTPKDQP